MWNNLVKTKRSLLVAHTKDVHCLTPPNAQDSQPLVLHFPNHSGDPESVYVGFGPKIPRNPECVKIGNEDIEIIFQPI